MIELTGDTAADRLALIDRKLHRPYPNVVNGGSLALPSRIIDGCVFSRSIVMELGRTPKNGVATPMPPRNVLANMPGPA
jgi:hypothetical protein